MRTLLSDKIRAQLRNYSDGLTVSEVAKLVGAVDSTVRFALKSMPDSYIDRWLTTGAMPKAVWCVVEVPEDCPKPKKGRKE